MDILKPIQILSWVAIIGGMLSAALPVILRKQGSSQAILYGLIIATLGGIFPAWEYIGDYYLLFGAVIVAVVTLAYLVQDAQEKEGVTEEGNPRRLVALVAGGSVTTALLLLYVCSRVWISLSRIWT